MVIYKISYQYYFFINSKHPSFDVGIMVVGNVINCKDRSIFFRGSSFRPKWWISLLEKNTLYCTFAHLLFTKLKQPKTIFTLTELCGGTQRTTTAAHS